MHRFFIWVFALGFLGLTLMLGAMALCAVFGFVHPALDVFNHIQPLLFAGLLFGLLAGPFFVWLPRIRLLVMALAATGLMVSAVVFVPEMTGRFLPLDARPADGRPVYKLLTHNLFGLNSDGPRMVSAIRAENADILTFQEYFEEQRSVLHQRLIADYPYFEICTGGKRANIAIYAKMPFEVEISGACGEGEALEDGAERVSRIVAHFKPENGSPFSVMTTHLDWPIQVSKLKDGQNLKEGFDLAIARQTQQFDGLEALVNSETGPLILSADFNSTSWSYALRHFQQITGMRRYTRGLMTYPTLWYYLGDWRTTLPFLTLDHVMARGGIEVHEIEKTDAAGSDHLGVTAVFSVAPATQQMASR